MSKHTPTPFNLPLAVEKSGTIGSVIDRDANCVLQIQQLEPMEHLDRHAKRQARAEFIVRAVNAHEALVEACEAALPYVEGAYECAFPDASENDSVVAQLRAALALAKGEVA